MTDTAAVAFSGHQPPHMVDDLVIPSTDGPVSSLWVPQGDAVDFRPLLFNVTQGYFVNILRVRRTGILSRHRHTGPVHAYVLAGRWHYLEHDWWVSPGSYAFEPPGETHTLEVPEDVVEMQTLFHVTGAYLYVDSDGQIESSEDVFTKLERARSYCDATGISQSVLDPLIR